MSTVEGKKQEKRRALLDAAYELFLERGTSKTSVEDITSRAKVGKGTFYLYFADKGSVTQALLARVSYQLLDNACAAAEQHAAELTSFPDQMIFVIDHIIEALRADTLMLRFLERSFVWPGLDQIEASGEAEPLMRKVLQIVMCSPEMAGRTGAGDLPAHHRPGQHVHIGVLHLCIGGQTRQHRQHEAHPLRYHPPGALSTSPLPALAKGPLRQSSGAKNGKADFFQKSPCNCAKNVVSYSSRYDIWTVSSAGRASA